MLHLLAENAVFSLDNRSCMEPLLASKVSLLIM